MRLILLTILVFLVYACGHHYRNDKVCKDEFNKLSNYPNDTLIAVFQSCTECLDLFVVQGTPRFPSHLNRTIPKYHAYDINVCGRFPIDYIDMSSFNYDSELAFKIVGKIIKVDSFGAPIFYVDKWTKFYYDRNGFQEKGDLGIYPKRTKMIKGILENFKIKGQSLKSMIGILGTPDFNDKNSVSYLIDKKYGSDIDPIFIRTLDLEFNKDSIIINVDLKEKKKNGR